MCEALRLLAPPLRRRGEFPLRKPEVRHLVSYIYIYIYIYTHISYMYIYIYIHIGSQRCDTSYEEFTRRGETRLK